MSRPAKKGLEFYSSDTDRYQDIKIRRLNQRFGCKGISVWDYILNEIYRVEGSYIIWDENIAFFVAEFYKDITESIVLEIVEYCCEIGLFNADLKSTQNILTSKRIQTQYLQVCTQAKRVKVNIPKLYDLIGFHENKSEFTQEETKFTQEEMPQSKVNRKESKLKEKERERETNLTAPDLAIYFLNSNFKERFNTDFVIPYGNKIQKYKEKFIKDFNDTVIMEKLEFDENILFARLRKYARNWIENQNKFNKTPGPIIPSDEERSKQTRKN